jgi:acetyl-CoA decarbonylase/synthase complex subunit delta
MTNTSERDSSLVTKKLLELAERFGQIELENVQIAVEELTLQLAPTVAAAKRGVAALQPPAPKLVDTLVETEFVKPLEVYPGQVAEVVLGATKSEGGTRSAAVRIGGAKVPPFYSFEGLNPNRPAFAMDVFDMRLTLPKVVRQHYEDVMDDPAAWAKKSVREFSADVISFNLISTDPALKNTSAEDAAQTVRDVLKAVDVPVIIGGSGNKQKDPVVLEKAAEATHGERCLLNSVSTDTDYKRVVNAALEHGHSVVAFTPMDINNQKKLNRLLLDAGLPKDKLVIDPTTGALGYGIEYSISLLERIKLAALKGDPELQMPILSAASNAWGAREAWMKTEELGPREYRGPLWETITGLAMLMSGADLFMVSHPATVRVLKGMVDSLLGIGETDQKIGDWITAIE